MPAQTTTQTQAPVYVNPYSLTTSHATLASVLLLAAIACFAAGLLLARRESLRELFARRASQALDRRDAVRRSA